MTAVLLCRLCRGPNRRPAHKGPVLRGRPVPEGWRDLCVEHIAEQQRLLDARTANRGRITHLGPAGRGW